MRYVFAVLVFIGCKDSSKDAEIARLKAQLAAQAQPAPNPQPETVPPPIEPGTDKPPPSPPVPETSDEMVRRIVNEHRLEPGDFPKLVKLADANKAVTYAHLKKSPDRYIGQPWRLYSRILEISETDGKTMGRISLSDYADQAVAFVYPKTTDFVENNRVEMVGVLGGHFDYTSQAGWNITIPLFEAVGIGPRGFIDKTAGIKRRRAADDE